MVHRGRSTTNVRLARTCRVCNGTSLLSLSHDASFIASVYIPGCDDRQRAVATPVSRLPPMRLSVCYPLPAPAAAATGSVATLELLRSFAIASAIY
jgi:hypothetical protein